MAGASKGPGISIHAEGLRELQARLREADRALPKLIRLGLNEIVNVILLPRVREKMERAFVLPVGAKKPTGLFRGGKLSQKTRATSQQREGRITEGGATTAYAGWWEFGGSTHSSRGDTTRPFIHEGRTLYPALAESTPEIRLAVDHLMGKLAEMVN